MINAYIIRIDDHKGQSVSANRVVRSITETGSVIQPVFFSATVPETISSHLYTEFNYFEPKTYRWNYPSNSTENGLDLATGLYKKAYAAADQKRVEACLISHMRLWDKCVSNNESMIILESDALFTRKFDVQEMKDAKICGLNDPRGATRRAKIFDDKVKITNGLQKPPIVNEPNEEPSPQGLAGNSAYYITPEGAKSLLDATAIYGGFPNDALMCRELFPWLRVIYPYYTKVQNTISTTTG